MVRKMLEKERIPLGGNETSGVWDEAIWRQMADLGLLGVHIPEAYGGMGCTHVELGIVSEELGRALCHVPYLSTIALAASAVESFGTEEQKQHFLPQIARGETLISVGGLHQSHSFSSEPQDQKKDSVLCKESGSDYCLNGTITNLIDGDLAHSFIVIASEDRHASEPASKLLIVPRDAPGVTVKPTPSLDLTRGFAEVLLSDVIVPGERVMTAQNDSLSSSCQEMVRRLFDFGRTALCAESTGAANACLDMAVAYAKARHQFERPIGSFQAIKHICADMLLRVESARSAANYASWVASHDLAKLNEAASLATAYCVDAFFFCAAENIQIHGGIGFTWEHEAHHYFKRASVSQSILGTARSARREYADSIGL